MTDGSGAPATAPRTTGATTSTLLSVNNIEVIYDHVILVLKGVSLRVPEGGIVALLGANGAGKSTTLKVLTRILEPTRGRYRVDGRIGALLEIGAGFHPDLTGRENIFLQGTIMGMKNREIRARFDEIVEFSGVADFIDTPVKRYSSGMYVRLAFAVAAHLEPEILLVDEVLAVGDVQFQKKCLGKIGDVMQQGRTVMFVSHNMSAVSRLCPESILLDRGQLVLRASTPEELRSAVREVARIGRLEDLPPVRADAPRRAVGDRRCARARSCRRRRSRRRRRHRHHSRLTAGAARRPLRGAAGCPAGGALGGDLDTRDSTAATGWGGAVPDLKDATTKGGMLYVFSLP